MTMAAIAIEMTMSRTQTCTSNQNDVRPAPGAGAGADRSSADAAAGEATSSLFSGDSIVWLKRRGLSGGPFVFYYAGLGSNKPRRDEEPDTRTRLLPAEPRP